jgi:hypothetical protein
MNNINPVINNLHAFLRVWLYGNYWVAGAVWALTRLTEYQIGAEGPSLAVFNAAGTLVFYGFARFFEGPPGEEGQSKITQWQSNMPNVTKLSMFMGVSLMAFESIRIFDLQILGYYFLGGAVAVLYPIPFLLRKRGGGLRSLPGLKLFLIASVWSYISAVLPALWHGTETSLTPLFLERFFWTAALTIPFDVRDMEVDANSLRTLPHLLGPRNSVWVANALLWFSFFLQVTFFEFPFAPVFGLYLFFSVIIIVANPKLGDYYYSFLIEGLPFLLLGLWLLLPYL